MRKVSDILYLPAPLSFIQIKKNKYEGVCPWCCKDLGKVEAVTYGELVDKLCPIITDHMDICVNREAYEIKVTI